MNKTKANKYIFESLSYHPDIVTQNSLQGAAAILGVSREQLLVFLNYAGYIDYLRARRKIKACIRSGNVDLFTSYRHIAQIYTRLSKINGFKADENAVTNIHQAIFNINHEAREVESSPLLEAILEKLDLILHMFKEFEYNVKDPYQTSRFLKEVENELYNIINLVF